MTPKRLEDELNKALETFREEIVFMADTFEQTHYNKYMDKDDMEMIGRQVFYLLADFKNSIIKYLKENSR